MPQWAGDIDRLLHGQHRAAMALLQHGSQQQM